MQMFTLTALAFLLVACSASTGSGERPRLVPAPAELRADCKRPVALPNRGLKQAEVEAYWGRDRANLVDCGKRHKALNGFYEDRDRRLQANDSWWGFR